MNYTPRIRRCFAAVLIAALSASAIRCSALDMLGYEPRLHDRFYVGPDKAFIGEGHQWSRPGDWSGVGREMDPADSGETWWNVTMISDTFFLMVSHVHMSRFYDDPLAPVPPVRFYRDNDPNGEFWEGTVEILPGNFDYTGFNVQNDLWLCRMEDAPPDWVRRYPLLQRNLETNWNSFLDPTIYTVGAPQAWDSYTAQRVGRNTINNSFTGALTYDVNSPPGLGADESKYSGGDSGSPTFAITPAGLTLFGLNQGPNGGPMMSANINAIQAALLPYGEKASVVTDLLGDLDADFEVDQADLDILDGNSSIAAGAFYQQGDLNRDGAIDLNDRSIMQAQLGKKLRAPSDFDQNNIINGADFSVIANHWLQTVAPLTNGDASGDSLVNRDDVVEFESNRVSVLTGTPLIQFAGDANNSGLVDNNDLILWAANKGRTNLTTPFTDGDVTGDLAVNHDDLVVIRDHYGAMYADVTGDLRVTISDIDEIAANWLQSVAGGRSDGDLDLDGIVDEADLASAGSFLGTIFRYPAVNRNAGIVPGDFNGDFFIDGADLLVWQRAVGTALPAADADKNGMIDGADLAVWAANYELDPPAPPAAVPEPASYVLGGAAALAAAYLRRRRPY